MPDTFKDGSEVVVKGTLGPDGFVVEPNGVMAKCPSKYEAGIAGAPGQSARPAPATKSVGQLARPMPALGTFLLLTCFVVAAYAATASHRRARGGSRHGSPKAGSGRSTWSPR